MPQVYKVTSPWWLVLTRTCN